MRRISLASLAVAAALMAGCGGAVGDGPGDTNRAAPRATAPDTSDTGACELPAEYVAEHPWVRNIPC